MRDPNYRYFGTVRWFSKRLGFGIIVTEEVSDDATETEIFAHNSEIVSPWKYKALTPGENVYFNIDFSNEKGLAATKIYIKEELPNES